MCEKSFISLKHLEKVYSNNVQAVFDFNLDIKEHEFIVFVGPSGCGKSTTLRMVAGLEDITRGELYIDGEYANELEPKDRDVAMVFQSYALYPHMTVYQNLAFGLEVRGIPKEEIRERIERAARILQIEEYLDRKPKALSGGQCQRVALGRAIVRNAKLFLMDEPLSNLDAKLRVQMRSEIVSLHNELGSTTIYVTHDQTEAMTMATRIVVMNKGYIQQIGTPKEIYDCPANTFVATFIGSPAMNIIDVTYNDGVLTFKNGLKIELTPEQKVQYIKFYEERLAKLNVEKDHKLMDKETKDYLLSSNEKKTKEEKAQLVALANVEEELDNIEREILHCQDVLANNAHHVLFGIRPEDVVQVGTFSPATLISDSFDAEIKVAELLGNEYYLHFDMEQCDMSHKDIIAKVFALQPVQNKEIVKIAFDLKKYHVFDKESGLFIL